MLFRSAYPRRAPPGSYSGYSVYSGYSGARTPTPPSFDPQALITALDEDGSVGIVRYAARKGAAPRVACLWPSQKCLWLCLLPFAEEVKEVEWPAPTTAAPSSAQLAAADALVDALELRPMSKEGGAPKEQVRSRWPWRPVGLPARSLRASVRAAVLRASATKRRSGRGPQRTPRHHLRSAHTAGFQELCIHMRRAG